ncbi:MAG: metal-dependent hydrolase [Chloroflexi bacterium]|nr:MAG: metal-dependent hydrolase [Chloroflexota bacterium]MBL1192912.1 metal-dependent hydrolase [Chloroflexota bacterium]NOH10205.1 metal-dependent hydrolase [Chloroflexota bacterium]
MTLKYTWYGHGTFGLDLDGTKIVIDPFFEGNPAASTTLDKLEADFIWVSHGHGDHIADAGPLHKQTGAQVITNAEIAGWLGKQGVETHAQHIGGGFQHPFGHLKFTYAQHGSGLPDGSDGGNPVGFLLTTADNKKVYFACDTGLFGDMALIGESSLDLAVLPIGDNFTMGPDDAVRAAQLLKPKHVIPAHYNTWGLIEQDAMAWAQRIEAETDAKAHVLQPGDTFDI